MRRAALAVLGAVAALGPAAAAAAPQPAHPRATVVLVPGSGFHGVGPRKHVRLSLDPALWRGWGYRTRMARYRAGSAGYRDVAAVIRAAERARPQLPLCVYGESSGGTAALVAAAADPAVDCVVISASPTDQETWAQSDRHGARRLAREVWPGYFGGPEDDNAFEPFDVWQQARPATPVLLVYAEDDQAVPAQQGRIFDALGLDTTLRVLGRGHHQFVHGFVNTSQFLAARAAVRAFTRAATAAR